MNSVINTTMGYTDSGEPSLSHQEYITTEQDENNQCEDYVQQRRRRYNLTSDQTLMIAFAWVRLQERNMFMKFQSLIYIDSTMDTNNETGPLLLMVP